MDCCDLETVSNKNRVLVFGWYGKGNIGDQSFQLCFKYLFPTVDFTFTDVIPDNVNSYHCVFIGGGDIFNQKIPNIDKIKIPVGLIGIGYGNTLPSNKFIFDKAELVITRNPSPYIVASDLCFSLPLETSNPIKSSNKVTVFLNDFLTPGNNSEDWVRDSHSWFTSQFASICDEFMERGDLEFVPFCVNPHVDDRRAAAFVISKMRHKNRVRWNVSSTLDFDDIKRIITNSSLIVTQRLHGSIFSYIYGVPQISVNHHDKMSKFCGDRKINSNLNYYGFNKEIFSRQLNQPYLNADRVSYLSSTRKTWQELSHLITQKFNL